MKDYRNQTSLHTAALENKVEWIKPLLEIGANPYTKDIDGNTPLYLAMKLLDFDDEVQYKPDFIEEKQKRQAEAVRAFLESGKVKIDDPIDDMDNTLLHLAIISGNNFLLSEILQHNPKFNVLNKDGISPLDMAVEYQKDKALQLLLEYACKNNINVKYSNATDINERDALKVAIENNYSAELIEKLLKSGASPNTQDKSGHTALHYAADYSDDSKVLRLLIQHGADPKIKNNESQTPLDIANQYDNQEIIEMLEKALKASEKKASEKIVETSNQQSKHQTAEKLPLKPINNQKSLEKVQVDNAEYQNVFEKPSPALTTKPLSKTEHQKRPNNPEPPRTALKVSKKNALEQVIMKVSTCMKKLIIEPLVRLCGRNSQK